MPRVRTNWACDYKVYGCTYDAKAPENKTKNAAASLAAHIKHCKLRPSSSATIINNITNNNTTNNNITNNIITNNYIIGSEDILPILKNISKEDKMSLLVTPEYSLSAYLPHLLWFNNDLPNNQIISRDKDSNQPSINGHPVDYEKTLKASYGHARTLYDMLRTEVPCSLQAAWNEYGRVITENVQNPVKVSPYWPGQQHLPLDEDTVSLRRIHKDMECEMIDRLDEIEDITRAMTTKEIMDYILRGVDPRCTRLPKFPAHFRRQH